MLLLALKLSLAMLAPLVASLYLARLVAGQGDLVFSGYSIVTLTNTSVFVVFSSFLQVMFFTGGRALGRDDRPAYAAAMRAGWQCALLMGLVATVVSALLGPVLALLGFDPALVALVAWFGPAAAIGMVPLVLQVVVRVDASLNARAGRFTAVVVAGALASIVAALAVVRLARDPREAALAVLVALSLVQWAVLVLARAALRPPRGGAPIAGKADAHTPDPQAWKDLWFYGWPIGAVVLMDSAVKIASTLAMARWWIDTVPAHSAIVLWLALALVMSFGLSQVGVQKVAIAHARGDAALRNRVARAALALVAAYGALVAVVLNLFAVEAGALLLPGAETQARTSEQLRALMLPASLVIFFEGLVVVAAGLLRGIGLTRTLLVQALVSYAVFGTGAQVVLAGVLGLGAAGLWWGLVVGFGVAAAAVTWSAVRHLRAGPAPAPSHSIPPRSA